MPYPLLHTQKNALYLRGKADAKRTLPASCRCRTPHLHQHSSQFLPPRPSSVLLTVTSKGVQCCRSYFQCHLYQLFFIFAGVLCAVGQNQPNQHHYPACFFFLEQICFLYWLLSSFGLIVFFIHDLFVVWALSVLGLLFGILFAYSLLFPISLIKFFNCHLLPSCLRSKLILSQ